MIRLQEAKDSDELLIEWQLFVSVVSGQWGSKMGNAEAHRMKVELCGFFSQYWYMKSGVH